MTRWQWCKGLLALVLIPLMVPLLILGRVIDRVFDVYDALLSNDARMRMRVNVDGWANWGELLLAFVLGIAFWWSLPLWVWS